MADVRRARARVVVTATWVALVVGAAACAGVTREVEGPHGVAGYRSVHALFYVVPVEGGVVLVDAGFDPSGDAVRAAVGDAPIKAVLITHSHVDHWSGAFVAGGAPVYASAPDAAVMRGERHHRALVNHGADHQWPRPPLPERLVAVDDGEVLELGGERFVAHVLPGHTAGSVAWQWRDVLFSGDAVLGAGDGVAVGPPLVSDDRARARRALSRLWGIDVRVLLDGHTGRVDDAGPKLARAIGETPRALAEGAP